MASEFPLQSSSANTGGDFGLANMNKMPSRYSGPNRSSLIGYARAKLKHI